MTTQQSRPWREIAAEASREQDSERLIELAKDVIRAYEEQVLMRTKSQAKRSDSRLFLTAL